MIWVEIERREVAERRRRELVAWDRECRLGTRSLGTVAAARRVAHDVMLLSVDEDTQPAAVAVIVKGGEAAFPVAPSPLKSTIQFPATCGVSTKE